MRYTKMAVAVAILSLGIMSVAAFAPHPSQPEALETFYVPAQHVNAATIEEPVQDFY